MAQLKGCENAAEEGGLVCVDTLELTSAAHLHHIGFTVHIQH